MGKILGIDLGTSNSAGAVLVPAGENRYIARIVREKESELNYIPSVVFFDDGRDEPIVGQRAKRSAIDLPERTVMRLKTKMGSDYTVNIDGREYTPEMISTFILKRIKELAEDMIKEPITEAKISVPSIFDAAQKKATLEAAKSSRLFEKVDIMTEPIATAFACSYYKVIGGNDRRLMVVDIGAGTTDIEIIDVSGEIFEVVCRTGDPELGGDNMDEEIVKYLKEEFKKQIAEQGGDLDLIDDGIVNKNLRREAESTKIQLSTQRTVEIFVEIADYFVNTTLTRAKLEKLIFRYSFSIDAELEDDLNESIISEKLKHIFKTKAKELSLPDSAQVRKEKENEWVIIDEEKKSVVCFVRKEDGKLSIYSTDIITRIRKEIRRAFEESRLKKEDIDKIALVGGPTNMPIIRELVKEEVGDWEEKVDPFTCVAIGAAHSGLVIDITPFSYGLADVIMTDKLEEYEGEIIKTFTVFDEIIKRGTILPARGEKVVTAEPGTFKIPLCIVQDKYAAKKIYKVLGDYEYYLPIPERGVEAREGEEIKIKFTLKDNEILDVTAEDQSEEKLELEATTEKKGEIIKLVNPDDDGPEPPRSKLLLEAIKKMGLEGFNAINTMREATNLLKSGVVRDEGEVKNAIDELNSTLMDVVNKIIYEAITKAIEKGITPDPNDPAVEDALCEIIRLEVEVSERDKDRIKRKTADLMVVIAENTKPEDILKEAIKSAEEAIDKAEVKLQEAGISDKDRKRITSKIDEVKNAIRGRVSSQIKNRTTELESKIANL